MFKHQEVKIMIVHHILINQLLQGQSMMVVRKMNH
ncbi:hypothetical protein ZPR_1622 [Zunongwangia profunda SM-A87]|uniref:Uncharacterized protein n=1 Tax=Zunongwangia profunda (strain DSM 18752 / CCTCC AB 206139 / SM-A87) TaxID=655815 RepID=D5BL58_ZUNPS|nr:hypothetical protein ZPR_1622 [Zunongwangia profunda SM-A87]